MKEKLFFISLLSLLPALSSADTLGVRAGVTSWQYDISGTARYQSRSSSDDIDVNDDLGYDDDSLINGYIIFEHPVPVLPNVKISRTDIDTDANGVMNSTFTWGSITFPASTAVSSELKLDQTDIALYYRILDNVVSLDLGLNAKYIDMEATITDRSGFLGSETADVSGWVPMLYAGVGADLPLTGLAVSADGSAIAYQDSNFYDFTVRATYTTPWFVGIDVGYRKMKLDLDDFDDSYADIEFDGPYAGAYLHF